MWPALWWASPTLPHPSHHPARRWGLGWAQPDGAGGLRATFAQEQPCCARLGLHSLGALQRLDSSHTPFGAPQPPHPTLQPGHSHATPVDHVQYMGMAPTARLAFIDLGDGTSDSIYTPADLAGGYFDYTYAVVSAWHPFFLSLFLKRLLHLLSALMCTASPCSLAFKPTFGRLRGGGEARLWRCCGHARCLLRQLDSPSASAGRRVACGWRRHWLASPCISHTGPTSPLGSCPSSIAAPSA